MVDIDDKTEGLLAVVVAILVLILFAINMSSVALGLAVIALCCLAAVKFLKANEEPGKKEKKAK
jgi:hypothetical protein